MTVHTSDSGQLLVPDTTRIALRLFLPGEETHEGVSRVSEIAERVLALSEPEAEAEAKHIVDSFTGGVDHFTDALHRHADSIAYHREEALTLSSARKLVMGAAFTREYAVEGAALCNPSAVPHPDQSDLEPGQLRVAVALRGIGEGHISSVEFISAVIGPGPLWQFGERRLPLVMPLIGNAHWVRDHFMHTLKAELGGKMSEITHAVARALPELFQASDLERAIGDLPHELLHRYDAARHLDRLRALASAAYKATFPADSELSQRVLMPFADDEINGMEDARFTLCTYPDGTTAYRATYTAYDGRAISPRLIVSPDLVTFELHRFTGAAAKNKGMALFPRHVGGELLALTRSDGESLGISRSLHGRVWDEPQPLRVPTMLWEIIQTGNCGSPIETEHGWLVLTHGVGPMRRYSIGAILLDLDDPSRVIASLKQPLLKPDGDGDREGYVPNVVYSCGGIVHDDLLWIPYGVGDSRVRVASVGVNDLVDAMAPNGAG